MMLRFRIRDFLTVVALVGLFVGFFAPELRAWDRNSLMLFAVLGIITIIALASFTPVWIVLLWIRRRSRRGLGIRAVDYLLVLLAFFSGLGIIVAIAVAIRWLVARYFSAILS